MTPRPIHTHWRYLLLVAAGGSVGTALREAVGLLVPTPGWPLGIAIINVSGSFALGALLESLARRGPDEGGRRALRLGIGTGVLGGYTTYSALAVDSVKLVAGGQSLVAFGYAAGSVLAGALAALLGIWCGGLLVPRAAADRRPW